MRIIAIDRQGEEHQLTGEPGQNLMEVLRDAGLDVEAVCGGCCSCATCHVLVDAQWLPQLPPRGAVENELLSLSAAYDEQASRLSCQIDCSEPLDALRVTIAPEE